LHYLFMGCNRRWEKLWNSVITENRSEVFCVRHEMIDVILSTFYWSFPYYEIFLLCQKHSLSMGNIHHLQVREISIFLFQGYSFFRKYFFPIVKLTFSILRDIFPIHGKILTRQKIFLGMNSLWFSILF
jgi:hypothetical protein